MPRQSATLTRKKVAGDTTQAFTWGTSANYSAAPFSYAGLDPTTPTEGAIYLAHTSGTTYPTGTVTPTLANGYALTTAGWLGLVSNRERRPLNWLKLSGSVR